MVSTPDGNSLLPDQDKKPLLSPFPKEERTTIGPAERHNLKKFPLVWLKRWEKI